MNRLRKTMRYTLCIMMIFTGFMIYKVEKISAATFYVSASPTTVSPGQSFTVTISLSEAGSGVFYLSGSNASVQSRIFCATTCSVTATAGSSGTASVTATAGAANTADEVTTQNGNNPITGARSASVTIKQNNNSGGSGGGSSNNGGGTTNNQPSGGGSGNGNETTPPNNDNDGKSSEASLASLSVDKGKLNPAFDENVTSYDLGLTDDVKSITIDAKAKDSKATISGNGAHELKVGTNDLNITVTAENGSVKTYTIHVTVEEKPKDYLTYNGQKLGILTNVDGVTAPDGFVRTDVLVGKKKINGWYNATSKIHLIYLADKDMIKHFYMVENGKITSIYQPITLFGKSLVMIDVPKVLQKKTGMKFTTVTIDNQKMPGWTFLDKQFANYTLIYVMDPSGKVLYYQYEKTENTLQLFSGAAAITMADYDKEKDTGESGNPYVMYGALGLSVVLAGGLIYMYLRNKKNVAYLMTQRRIQFQDSLDDTVTKENGEE